MRGGKATTEAVVTGKNCFMQWYDICIMQHQKQNFFVKLLPVMIKTSKVKLAGRKKQKTSNLFIVKSEDVKE